jgi:hypothetical protein
MEHVETVVMHMLSLGYIIKMMHIDPQIVLYFSSDVKQFIMVNCIIEVRQVWI